MQKIFSFFLLISLYALLPAQSILKNIDKGRTFSGEKPAMTELAVINIKEYSATNKSLYKELIRLESGLSSDVKDVFKGVVETKIQVVTGKCKEIIALKEGNESWIILPVDSLNNPNENESFSSSAEKKEALILIQMIYAIAALNTPNLTGSKADQLLIQEKMAQLIAFLSDYRGIRKVADVLNTAYITLPRTPAINYPSREERLGHLMLSYHHIVDSVQTIKDLERKKQDSIEATMPPPITAEVYTEGVVEEAAPPVPVVEEYINKAESLPKTKVIWVEDKYDFKKIKEGDVVEHRFKVKNVGQFPLEITNVKPSCGCTATYCTQTSINPGEECEIVAKFNSAGKSGQQTKSITVTGNFEGDINHPIKITGEVIPQEKPTKEKRRK